MTDSLLLSMDNPPQPLSGSQLWRVKVRRSSASGGGADPTVAVELWEGGLHRTGVIAPSTVTSTDAEILSGAWLASSLADVSGTGAQARVVAERGADGAVVEIASLEWIPAMYSPASKTPFSRTLRREARQTLVAGGSGAARRLSSGSSRVLTASGAAGTRSL